MGVRINPAEVENLRAQGMTRRLSRVEMKWSGAIQGVETCRATAIYSDGSKVRVSVSVDIRATLSPETQVLARVLESLPQGVAQ